MIDAVRRHLLGYALSAAIGLAVLRFFMPGVVDFVIDLATVGLVWVAVRLGQTPASRAPASEKHWSEGW